MMKALPICPRRRWPMPASGAACRCASLHPGVGAVVNGHRIAGRALPALASRRFEPHLVSTDDIVFGDADGLLRAADPSYTFRRRLRRIGGAIEE